jgi:hypothetical protein
MRKGHFIFGVGRSDIMNLAYDAKKGLDVYHLKPFPKFLLPYHGDFFLPFSFE